MNYKQLEVTGTIFITTLVLTIGFLIGQGCAKSRRKPAIPNESLRTEFERGRLQGMQDAVKLLADLGMEGKTVHMGLPIGSGRWMNMKYELIEPNTIKTNAFIEATATNAFITNSITISNASEKTIKVEFPHPLQAKEEK